MSGIVSLVISLLSIIMAVLALGWNIYRDIIMKGRVKIQFGWYIIVDGEVIIPDTIRISGVNHGPGKVVIKMIYWKKSSIVRRLRRTVVKGFIKLTKKPLEYSDMLPKELDVGDELNLIFPSSAGFADLDFSHLGLGDNFGRVHWARKKDIQNFRDKRKNMTAKALGHDKQEE